MVVSFRNASVLLSPSWCSVPRERPARGGGINGLEILPDPVQPSGGMEGDAAPEGNRGQLLGEGRHADRQRKNRSAHLRRRGKGPPGADGNQHVVRRFLQCGSQGQGGPSKHNLEIE